MDAELSWGTVRQWEHCCHSSAASCRGTPVTTGVKRGRRCPPRNLRVGCLHLLPSCGCTPHGVWLAGQARPGRYRGGGTPDAGRALAGAASAAAIQEPQAHDMQTGSGRRARGGGGGGGEAVASAAAVAVGFSPQGAPPPPSRSGKQRRGSPSVAAVEGSSSPRGRRRAGAVAPPPLEEISDRSTASGGSPAVSLSVDLQSDSAVLTNVGGREVALEGWTLRSQVGDQAFTFPLGSLLPAHSSATVCSGKRAEAHAKDARWRQTRPAGAMAGTAARAPHRAAARGAGGADGGRRSSSAGSGSEGGRGEGAPTPRLWPFPGGVLPLR